MSQHRGINGDNILLMLSLSNEIVYRTVCLSSQYPVRSFQLYASLIPGMRSSAFSPFAEDDVGDVSIASTSLPCSLRTTSVPDSIHQSPRLSDTHHDLPLVS